MPSTFNTRLLAAFILAYTSTCTLVAGQEVVSVDSATNFCMMMPPTYGGDIAANEDVAVSFCTNQNSGAPGAQIFPSGFIVSAHYLSTGSYWQVTGQIDPSKYGLSLSDQGGQYDPQAPVGASCRNAPGGFVNLIEPADGTYCIRCCQNKGDCNRSISTAGCSVIVPGDYSGGTSGGSTSTGSDTTTTTASSSTTTTTTSSSSSASSSSSSLSTTVSSSSAPVTAATTSSATPVPTTPASGAVTVTKPMGLMAAAASIALALFALV